MRFCTAASSSSPQAAITSSRCCNRCRIASKARPSSATSSRPTTATGAVRSPAARRRVAARSCRIGTTIAWVVSQVRTMVTRKMTAPMRISRCRRSWTRASASASGCSTNTPQGAIREGAKAMTSENRPLPSSITSRVIMPGFSSAISGNTVSGCSTGWSKRLPSL